MPWSGRRRWLFALAALYLSALAVSHLVEPDPQRLPAPELGLAEVQAVDGERVGPGLVRVAYRRYPVAPTGVSRSPTPVLYLHGSPGSHRDFDRLGPELAARGFPGLAPDLPGFGASTRELPDYSVRAHARYVLELLDALGVERAHLLGFSMGGGVALELYRLAPERVASLVMLSSIGVQEMELLGDYTMNHVLHGLQLGALWLLQRAVPHFGTLTSFPLDLPYARNFYDTDQRPLRGVLRELEVPLLVVHGSHDFLVPPEAAYEHHRLVPQSELLMLDADHFFVFTGEPDVGPALQDFWTRVEAGRATSRSGAAAVRVRAAAAPYDRRDAPRWMGPALLVMGSLLALSTLVSEDLTSIGAGLLVADGRMPFAVATAACAAGIFLGDLLLFAVGRLIGRRALRLPPLRWWLSESAVERSSDWFERRGPVVVLLSRFTPGTRLATYVAAGILRTSFLRFALWMAIAVAAWTPLLVLFARLAGEAAFARLDTLRTHLLVVLGVPLVVLLLMRRVLLPLFTWRGRRTLVGSWKRWTRWEFWPPWLFYPPILAWVAWLAVRHRGLTVFTAANPGFPAGGFVGESKSEILTALGRATEALDAAAGTQVPVWHRIEPGPLDRRLDDLSRFLAGSGLVLPVILKPDVGQRGQGVTSVGDLEAAARWLERHPGPAIAQRRIEGPEYGVFYHRLPSSERGHILSITEKVPPVLLGDGHSTLEQLVLRDRRAVAMARVYRDELGLRWHQVPARGEAVRLVDVGTHARGSIFLDGSRRITPTLECAIDELSRGVDGFFFGRYDIRVAAEGDLEAARDLQLLELNGVTAESTDIYDPRNTAVDAWRKLARQWSLAFEIGAENRSRGAKVTTLRELAKLLWQNRRQLPR